MSEIIENFYVEKSINFDIRIFGSSLSQANILKGLSSSLRKFPHRLYKGRPRQCLSINESAIMLFENFMTFKSYSK